MGNIIMTGFQDLDYLVKGFRDSELILIAGRPGMGKTSFVFNVMRYAMFIERIPTVYFSLEMSEEQIRGRINNMKWNPKNELIIDDTPAITIEELADKSRKYKEEKQIGLILIDYFQLIRDEECKTIGDEYSFRNLEVSSIIQKLKKLACELSIPIVIISQYPKMVDYRMEHRPILPDLKIIGDIETYTDIILFLYRDEIYNKNTESKGIAEVIVAKNHRGKTGTVRLHFRPELCRFTSMVPEKMEIEITGTDVYYTDKVKGIRCRCHQEFKKSIFDRFRMRNYELVDTGFENVLSAIEKILDESM